MSSIPFAAVAEQNDRASDCHAGNAVSGPVDLAAAGLPRLSLFYLR